MPGSLRIVRNVLLVIADIMDWRSLEKSWCVNCPKTTKVLHDKIDSHSPLIWIYFLLICSFWISSRHFLSFSRSVFTFDSYVLLARKALSYSGPIQTDLEISCEMRTGSLPWGKEAGIWCSPMWSRGPIWVKPHLHFSSVPAWHVTGQLYLVYCFLKRNFLKSISRYVDFWALDISICSLTVLVCNRPTALLCNSVEGTFLDSKEIKPLSCHCCRAKCRLSTFVSLI